MPTSISGFTYENWVYLAMLGKQDICDRKTNIESAKLKYNTHMSTPILYKKNKILIELVFTLTIFLQNVFDIFTKKRKKGDSKDMMSYVCFHSKM